MVVAKQVQPIMEGLKKYYNFKSTTMPSHHLGVDYYSKLNSEGKRKYQLGSETYVKEAVHKMKGLSADLGRIIGYPKKAPMDSNWKPELDDS